MNVKLCHSAAVNDILILLKKQLTLSADKRFLSPPPHSASCPSAFEEKHFHKLSHGSANHLSGSPREREEEEQDRKTGDKLDGDSGQEFKGLDQERSSECGNEPQGAGGGL